MAMTRTMNANTTPSALIAFDTCFAVRSTAKSVAPLCDAVTALIYSPVLLTLKLPVSLWDAELHRTLNFIESSVSLDMQK